MAFVASKAAIVIGVKGDATQFTKTMKSVHGSVAGWSRLIMYSFAAIGAGAIKFGAQFEHAMRKTAAITEDPIRALKVLTKEARKMGETTTYSALEAADAMYALAAAGLTIDETMAAAQASLYLAGATTESLAKATELVASTMKSFGLGASAAADIADTFALGINKSLLTMERLSEAMKYAGTIGAGFGMSLQEVTAAVAAFTNFGLQGCYDEETEVLTKGGWKFWKDVDEDDEFLTVNQDTDEFEYQKPTKLFKYEIDEDLIHISNKDVDLLITNNHNMYANTGGGYKLIRADELVDDNETFCVKKPNDDSVDECEVNDGDIAIESYSGYVYCAEVPNHTIVVRRMGRVVVCGNSLAGTQFRMAMMGISSATDRVTSGLNAVGTSMGAVREASDNFKSFSGLIQHLSTKTIDLTYYYDIFGKRAAASMMKLVQGARDGDNQVQKLLDSMKDRAGEAQRTYEFMMQSVQSQFTIMVSKVKELTIEMFTGSREPMLGFIKDMQSYLDSIIQYAKANKGAFTELFGDALSTLSMFIDLMLKATGVIVRFATTFPTLTKAIIGLLIINKVTNGFWAWGQAISFTSPLIASLAKYVNSLAISAGIASNASLALTGSVWTLNGAWIALRTTALTGAAALGAWIIALGSLAVVMYKVAKASQAWQDAVYNRQVQEQELAGTTKLSIDTLEKRGIVLKDQITSYQGLMAVQQIMAVADRNGVKDVAALVAQNKFLIESINNRRLAYAYGIEKLNAHLKLQGLETGEMGKNTAESKNLAKAKKALRSEYETMNDQLATAIDEYENTEKAIKAVSAKYKTLSAEMVRTGASSNDFYEKIRMLALGLNSVGAISGAAQKKIDELIMQIDTGKAPAEALYEVFFNLGGGVTVVADSIDKASGSFAKFEGDAYKMKNAYDNLAGGQLNVKESLITMSNEVKASTLFFPKLTTAIEKLQERYRQTGDADAFISGMIAVGQQVKNSAGQLSEYAEKFDSAVSSYEESVATLSRERELGALSSDKFTASLLKEGEKLKNVGQLVPGYADKLKSLQEKLEKNTISTREYTIAVDDLNTAFKKTSLETVVESYENMKQVFTDAPQLIEKFGDILDETIFSEENFAKATSGAMEQVSDSIIKGSQSWEELGKAAKDGAKVMITNINDIMGPAYDIGATMENVVQSTSESFGSLAESVKESSSVMADGVNSIMGPAYDLGETIDGVKNPVRELGGEINNLKTNFVGTAPVIDEANVSMEKAKEVVLDYLNTISEQVKLFPEVRMQVEQLYAAYKKGDIDLAGVQSGLEAIGQKMSDMGTVADETAAQVDNNTAALQENADALTDGADAWGDFIEGTSKGSEELQSWFAEVVEGIVTYQKLSAEVKALGTEANNLVTIFERYSYALNLGGIEAEALRVAMEGSGAEMLQMAEQLRNMADMIPVSGINGLQRSLELAAAATELEAQALVKLNMEAREAALSMERLTLATQELLGIASSAQGAISTFASMIQDLTWALQNNLITTTDYNTAITELKTKLADAVPEGSELYNAIMKLLQSFLAGSITIDQFNDALSQMTELGSEASDAMADLSDELSGHSVTTSSFLASESLDYLSARLATNRDKAIETNDAYAALLATMSRMNSIDVGTFSAGGTVGYNKGGFLRMAGGGMLGGSSGIDKNFGMFPAGSFIVNARATKKHMNELLAMSGALKPAMYSRGEYFVDPSTTSRNIGRLNQINADRMADGGPLGLNSDRREPGQRTSGKIVVEFVDSQDSGYLYADDKAMADRVTAIIQRNAMHKARNSGKTSRVKVS